MCLAVIEISDVMFAFDSVPAVIAVSREPLIVYSAMLFAILGLRTLYFVLEALKRYLVHLEKAVIVLLFFIAAKLGLKPGERHILTALRVLMSTGSPLAPEGFDYVYQAIKPDLQLASISGGTDIVSCFALGCPVRPVWRGELQCRGLGMKVEILDDDGRPVREATGELALATLPSIAARMDQLLAAGHGADDASVLGIDAVGRR